ncbi:MAG TPA: UPF0262 family protein [Acetobacteraceae bacterium]|jgi:uncharacterized protein (UPF0262 family)|nr:UPF0262 family protein [Acetobacteraceae bacterium]
MSRQPSGIVEGRLSRVVLDGEVPSSLPPALEADRAQAVADLAAENQFLPLTLKPGVSAHGPFVLHLAVQDGRLVFDIRRGNDTRLAVIGLALGPFRSLVKDYQLLVDSHIKAVEEGRAERIQAIDMGRRGLHNEGATLMRQRLEGKIAIDFATARRLFTLVCVLHQRI